MTTAHCGREFPAHCFDHPRKDRQTGDPNSQNVAQTAVHFCNYHFLIDSQGICQLRFQHFGCSTLHLHRIWSPSFWTECIGSPKDIGKSRTPSCEPIDPTAHHDCTNYTCNLSSERLPRYRSVTKSLTQLICEVIAIAVHKIMIVAHPLTAQLVNGCHHIRNQIVSKDTVPPNSLFSISSALIEIVPMWICNETK